MKKMLLFLCLLAGIADAQSLAVDKVDEFTKNTVKRTNWSKFTGSSARLKDFSYFRITRINESISLQMRLIMQGQVYAISKEDKIMFLMTDESVTEISPSEYEVTCTGCGATGFAGSAAMGTETNYYLSDKVIKELSTGVIKKVRVYTSLGYFEEEYSEGFTNKMRKCIALVQ